MIKETELVTFDLTDLENNRKHRYSVRVGKVNLICTKERPFISHLAIPGQKWEHPESQRIEENILECPHCGLRFKG